MFKQFAAAALAISISTGALAGDKSTSATFLSWSAPQKEAFVSNSVAMAAALSPSRADCIFNWNAKSQSDGYTDLTAAMQKYPKYHPTAILVAFLEKECGQLTMAQK